MKGIHEAWRVLLALGIASTVAACNPAADTGPETTGAAEPQAVSDAPRAEAYPPSASDGLEDSSQSAGNVSEPYPGNGADGATDADSGDQAEAGPSTDGQAAGAGIITFNVIPGSSRASYEVDEAFFEGAVSQLNKVVGEVNTVGITDDVSGQLTIDANGAPRVAGGEVRIGLDGLASDDDRRDRRVRERILDTLSFPDAIFVPTEMIGFPADYQPGDTAEFTLTGDLTVRDVTRTISLDVVATYTEDRVEATGTSVIAMSDFGIEPPSFAGVFDVGDEVRLTVELVAEPATQ